MAENNPVDSLPLELARHQRWLEELARHLVRERDAAADLAQDTFLAALRHAPAQVAELKPWLARVMRNRLADLGRRRAAREERESRAAREELQPDPTEVIERLELEKRLIEAVSALPEPYRGAVTLRYLEGQEPAEIARKQGIPAGTVRWRVSEGLTRLRRTLDREEGGRERWVRLFLPLAGLPATEAELGAAAASSLTLFGILFMKLSLATLSLALLVAVLWSTLGRSDRSDLASREDHTSTAPLVSDEPSPPEGIAGGVAPEQDELEARESIAIAEIPTPPGYPVRLRVVDENGRPIHGVLVRSLTTLPIPDDARTDADGRYELEWAEPAIGHTCMVELSAPGYERRELNQASAGDELDYGTITLRAGTWVAGRVVDEDGAPVAGVDVYADDGAILLIADRYDTVQTDDLGRFRIEGLPVGFARISTRHEGGDLWDRIEKTVELQHGVPLENLELVLPPPEGPGPTTGRILRPDGSPAAYAQLYVRNETDGRVNSFGADVDEDGRFVIKDRTSDRYELSAWDRNEFSLCVSRVPVERGAQDVELRLAQRPLIAFDLRGRGDEPVETDDKDLLLKLEGEEKPRRTGLYTREQDGRRVFPAPTVPFQVEVRADGYFPFATDWIEPDAAGDVLAIALESLPGISGRVVRGGQPVAGVEVTLQRSLLTFSRLWVDDLPREWDELHRSPTVKTDEDGRFTAPYELPPPPPQPSFLERLKGQKPEPPYRFAIRVDGGESGFGFVAPIALPEGGARLPIEIELAAGGAIEGRLLLPEDLSPNGQWILAGDGHSEVRAQRLTDDGRYRFENLPPGTWLVRNGGEDGEPNGSRFSSGGSGGPTEIAWDCEVRAGELTHFDIDERDEPRVVGRLRIDGECPGVWTVIAFFQPSEPGKREQFAGYETLDGRCELNLDLAAPGSYQLSLWGPLGADGPRVELLVPIEVHPGRNDLSIDIESAPVSGELKLETSAENLQLRAELEGGGSWMMPLVIDEERRFELAAPPGTIRIVRATTEDVLGEPLEVLFEGLLPTEGLEGVVK